VTQLAVARGAGGGRAWRRRASRAALLNLAEPAALLSTRRLHPSGAGGGGWRVSTADFCSSQGSGLRAAVIVTVAIVAAAVAPRTLRPLRATLRGTGCPRSLAAAQIWVAGAPPARRHCGSAALWPVPGRRARCRWPPCVALLRVAGVAAVRAQAIATAAGVGAHRS